MPDSAAMGTPMAESSVRSPSFEVPEYHIAIGKDGTLEWTPPADSPELASALSYHFPKQRSLKRKMRAAIRLFFRTSMERPEQAQPRVTSLSGKKSASNEEGADVFHGLEISNVVPDIEIVSRTDSFVHSTQLIDVVKIPEAILDIVPHTSAISEIIWKAETGEEVEFKPKKRQYTERERVEVGNNRGNVCKEHRQKKQKCNPLSCPQNKHYQKNNSIWQGVANQRQITGQGDSNEHLNEPDCNNSTSPDDCVQLSAPNANPRYRITGVDQTPTLGMGSNNVMGLIGSGHSLPSPGRTERSIKLVKPKTTNDLIEAPNLLSPAVSPGGVESPLSVKSPHVSYFDDAWVDSPYRVDDDQRSDSGFDFARKRHVPSPPETSIRERNPTYSTIYTETSNMRRKETKIYRSDLEDSESQSLDYPLNDAPKGLASVKKRRRRRIVRKVEDDYLAVKETDTTVEEREERADSWPGSAIYSTLVPQNNWTSGEVPVHGRSASERVFTSRTIADMRASPSTTVTSEILPSRIPMGLDRASSTRIVTSEILPSSTTMASTEDLAELVMQFELAQL